LREQFGKDRIATEDHLRLDSLRRDDRLGAGAGLLAASSDEFLEQAGAVLTVGFATKNQVDTRGKIIFLEDIHEIVPRLHRLLSTIHLAGLFDEAAGVILGDFNDWESPDYPNYSPQDMFRDFFKNFKIPVMYNIRCGHGFPTSTIPLGTRCVMDTSKKRIVFYRK